MKKLSLFILAAIVCSTASIAQDSTTTTTRSTMEKRHNMSHGSMKMKDCVMMKDGKMMVMKGGKKMDMETEMTLTNGSTINTEGMLTKQDGKTKQLKNGDGLYMDGKMVAKMNKSGMRKKVKTESTTTTTQ